MLTKGVFAKFSSRLLQHWISFQFLQHGGERTAQDPIDDMNVSVGGHQIRLNDCGIDATTFHSNGLVIVMAGHHVKVKESFIVVGRNLGDLKKVIQGANKIK